MRRRRTSGGFTLLELMIVVSIIAVAAGLASLDINRTKQRRTARQALLDLRAATERARTFAVQAGSRLGTPRVVAGVVPAGCGALEPMGIWVMRTGDNTYCVPEGLTSAADGTLTVDYALLRLGADEREYAGRVDLAPAGVEGFGFTSSGRLRSRPAGQAQVHLRMVSDTDSYATGFRVLASGVVCDAAEGGGPLCDSD